MEDFKLIALNCKNCDSGLTIEVNDNIVYCSSCGSGWEIIEDKLQPIEIGFASPMIRGDGEIIYKGFWVLDSFVKINSRDASGAWLSSFFGEKNKSEGNITFYVPSFWMTVDSLNLIGKEFTIKNPVKSPQKFNVKLTGFTYSREDAKKIAEFIFLSTEAEKNDVMRNISYDIKVNSYRIVGIPFYKQPNGKLRDAVLGIEII